MISNDDPPRSILAAARWKASLLGAARSWSTIAGFTAFARIGPTRYAAPISGPWALFFSWDYDICRAYDITLVRLEYGDFHEGDEL